MTSGKLGGVCAPRPESETAKNGDSLQRSIAGARPTDAGVTASFRSRIPTTLGLRVEHGRRFSGQRSPSPLASAPRSAAAFEPLALHDHGTWWNWSWQVGLSTPTRPFVRPVYFIYRPNSESASSGAGTLGRRRKRSDFQTDPLFEIVNFVFPTGASILPEACFHRPLPDRRSDRSRDRQGAIRLAADFLGVGGW